MTEGLRDGLGGIGRLAIEHALLEEDVEKESSDPCQNLDDRGRQAGDERHAPPLDVWAHGGGESLHHERHQTKCEVDHRLVRNERDRPHAGKGDGGADHIPTENGPQHVSAPLQNAPAIGEQLDD